MSMLKSMKFEAKAVRLITVLLVGAAALETIGCGVGSEFASTSIAGPALSGRVMGGRQPISGSTVDVWQVGNTGYGSAATLLATVTSGSDGSFSFPATGTGSYTCPSTGTNQLYITASGGNPGNSTGNANPAILLTYALGSCATAQAATGLNVNEVSTVASVFALSGFINPATFGSSGTTGTTVGSTYTQDAIGTSSTNTTGLNNAASTVNTLVTPAGITPGGITPGSATTATVDYQKINTLGNILANCVNSDPTNGDTICSSLFTNVGTNSLTGAVAATNTFEAAYYMNTNPTDTVSSTSKLTNVFNGVPTNPPYAPALGSAPSDWTIGVNYAVNGLTNANHIAIDGAGDAWVTGGSQLSEITPAGVVTSVTQTGDTTPIAFVTPYAVAVDKSNKVIVTDIGITPTTNGSGVFVFSTTTGSWVQDVLYKQNETALPYGIAIGEGADKLWVTLSPAIAAGKTTGGVLLGSTFGSPNAGVFNTFGNNNTMPYGTSGLVIDKAATLMSPLRYYNVTSTNAGGIETFSYTATATTNYYNGTSGSVLFPTAAVFDTTNTSTGATGSGFTGYLWYTNTAYVTISSTGYGSATTSSFLAKSAVTSANSNATVDTLANTPTTCTGGGINGATGLAIDGNSNLWVANSAGNSVSEFANSCSGATGAISPATTGFVHNLSSPTDIAVDASGNVWVVNNGATYVTQIVGAAGPAVVPLVLNEGTVGATPLAALWGTKP
jgi:hypothetical protein